MNSPSSAEKIRTLLSSTENYLKGVLEQAGGLSPDIEFMLRQHAEMLIVEVQASRSMASRAETLREAEAGLRSTGKEWKKAGSPNALALYEIADGVAAELAQVETDLSKQIVRVATLADRFKQRIRELRERPLASNEAQAAALASVASDIVGTYRDAPEEREPPGTTTASTPATSDWRLRIGRWSISGFRAAKHLLGLLAIVSMMGAAADPSAVGFIVLGIVAAIGSWVAGVLEEPPIEAMPAPPRSGQSTLPHAPHPAETLKLRAPSEPDDLEELALETSRQKTAVASDANE